MGTWAPWLRTWSQYSSELCPACLPHVTCRASLWDVHPSMSLVFWSLNITQKSTLPVISPPSNTAQPWKSGLSEITIPVWRLIQKAYLNKLNTRYACFVNWISLVSKDLIWASASYITHFILKIKHIPTNTYLRKQQSILSMIVNGQNQITNEIFFSNLRVQSRAHSFTFSFCFFFAYPYA